MLAELDRRCIRNATLIILGDANIGLGKSSLPGAYLSRFNELMRDRGVCVCFLRGNHDNPAFWDSPICEEIEQRWEQVRMLHQGALEINGELYYVFPGAISIDRKSRREGVDWYAGEKMQPAALPPSERPYRGIIGHNGPTPDDVSHLGFWQQCQKDDALADDVAAEEAAIAGAIESLLAHNAALGCHAVPQYYHGHYHQSWEASVQGVQGRCLAICEFLQLA